MQTTGNLGLKKPEGTDIVDIADLNGNMDILDNAVTSKVDKVTGKQLSTNDYTAAEKTKLAGIATGANNYVHPNHTGDVTSNGDGVTAIAAGVIVNADVNAAAGIDASKIGTGVVSNAEFGYLDGVTSGIQTQINNRLSTVGGNVTGPIIMNPMETTASSWANPLKFKYRDSSNVVQDKTLAVNTVGNLMYSTPGVSDHEVVTATNGDITYFVRTDGNDSNTGLVNTAAGAFKTINRAISLIPQVVNHIVSINVSAGTYAEDVLLEGINGAGHVEFNGNTVSIKSFTVARCVRVVVSGFTATSTTKVAFYAYEGVMVSFNNCITTVSNANLNGISIFNQRAQIEECTVSNRGTAIQIEKGQASIVNCTGTGNTAAILPSGGAVVNTVGTMPSGIIHGGFGGVANAWGDNTTIQRSAFAAGSNASVTTIAPRTWTKVGFGSEYFDYLGEYNPTTSTFTPKTGGVYLIQVAVSLSNAPQGIYAHIRFQKGATLDQLVAAQTMALSNDCFLVGSLVSDISGGVPITISVWHSHTENLTTGADGYYNYFKIVRIA